MESHWVAGELNLRVGSARNGYVLHRLHVGRSLWANLVWTQIFPICFTEIYTDMQGYTQVWDPYRLHNTHMVAYVPLYLYN